MNFQEFIKPELLILIPVLSLIGLGIKKSPIPNKWIPLLLGSVSICLCGMWVFADPLIAEIEVLTAIFTAITQGVLVSGASVYTHQIYVQIKKED